MPRIGKRDNRMTVAQAAALLNASEPSVRQAMLTHELDIGYVTKCKNSSRHHYVVLKNKFVETTKIPLPPELAIVESQEV